MRPLLAYESDDGHFVAPESPDVETALTDRVSEFFKARKDADAERLRLITEFQATGVYPPRVVD